MEVGFLRGATVILSDGNKRLICDPWLDDGIYYGAWAHYPEFTKKDWEETKAADVDYIYISHVHPDHFDPKTLSHFRGQKVIIHKFQKGFLKQKIEDLGFEVVELENGANFDMGRGFGIRVFAADNCDPTKCGAFFACSGQKGSSAQIDSLAVITTPTATAVNVNDCPWGLGEDLAKKIGNDYEVSAAFLAYGFAGAFPQCYRMSRIQKASICEGRKRQSLALLYEWAKALKTTKVLPFASGYQLCGPLSELNEDRGLPDIESMRAAMRSCGLEPIGNELFDSGRLDYICDVLSKRKLDYEDDPEPTEQELIDLIGPAFARYDRHRKDYGYVAEKTIYIELGKDHCFVIPPIGDGFITKIKGEPTAEKFLTIETDPRLLKKLLIGPKYAHWNNAEIGSHLTFTRMGRLEIGMSLLLSFLHG